MPSVAWDPDPTLEVECELNRHVPEALATLDLTNIRTEFQQLVRDNRVAEREIREALASREQDHCVEDLLDEVGDEIVVDRGTDLWTAINEVARRAMRKAMSQANPNQAKALAALGQHERESVEDDLLHEARQHIVDKLL